MSLQVWVWASVWSREITTSTWRSRADASVNCTNANFTYARSCTIKWASQGQTPTFCFHSHRKRQCIADTIETQCSSVRYDLWLMPSLSLWIFRCSVVISAECVASPSICTWFFCSSNAFHALVKCARARGRLPLNRQLYAPHHLETKRANHSCVWFVKW